MLRKSLFEKNEFESRPEGAEEMSYAYIWRKKILGACFDILEIYLAFPPIRI